MQADSNVVNYGGVSSHAEGERQLGADLEYMLESGPSDLRCRGIDGPITVTLSEDVLQIVDTASGHVAREVWLQDITAIYLRRKQYHYQGVSSPMSTQEHEAEEELTDQDDAEIVIVSFPLCAERKCSPCSVFSLCCCSCCCCSCCGSRLVRDEIEKIVLSAETPAILHHWEYAIVGAVSGKGFPDLCVSKAKKMLVIVSPESGQGRAEEVFESQVRPILQASRINCEVVITKGRMDATRIILDYRAEIADYDGVIAVGGDGIVYEIVQGLKRLVSADERLPIPLGVIPAGSGNGIAASLHHAVNEPINDPVTAAVGIARGRVQALDLWRVDMLDHEGNVIEPSYVSLSVSWAFVSDTDIESEAFRFLGGGRFTVQAVVNLLRFRKYECTLSYLPYDDEDTQSRNVELSSHSLHDSDRGTTHNDSSEHLTSSGDYYDAGLDVKDETPESWQTMSGTFLLMWAMNTSHPASDQHLIHDAQPDNGCIEIVLVRDINRINFTRGLLALESGQQFEVPGWERIRAKAFRMEAPQSKGSIPGRLVLDGELVQDSISRLQVQTSQAHSDFFSYIK